MLKCEIFNNRFETLVDLDQDVKLVCDPGGLLEGLCWSEKEQEISFTSLSTEQLCRWSEAKGLSFIRNRTNVANGMAYDYLGRLIICEQTGLRVSRLSRDLTEYEIIADEYDGKPFNSPNDVVVHSNGMIYFTDSLFGKRPGKFSHNGSATQTSQRLYMIDPIKLNLSVATEDLDDPNGLWFSPDETKMYIAESDPYCITVMEVMHDGTLGRKKLFAESPKRGKGFPDGIKADMEGNIWCSSSGGVHVFNRNGVLLGIIFTPKTTRNLCFGGSDLKTLFYTSDSELLAVRTKIPGIHLRR